jgi:AraC-like DNA-binding protein
MARSLAEARRAVAALGTRGRTTRVPEAVRERVLEYAFAERAEDKSWATLARELGLSSSTLQRWASGASRRPAPLRRVRVVGERRSEPPRVVLVSPAGYRLEGLDPEQALAMLGRLG